MDAQLFGTQMTASNSPLHLRNRHFIRSIRQVVVPAMAPEISDSRLPDGAVCETSQSAIIIVVSGICVMMLLVAIALLLVCCSYLSYRPQEDQHLEDARDGTGVAAPAAAAGFSSCENLALVLHPGETDPIVFARRCPLQEDNGRQQGELGRVGMNGVKAEKT